MKPGIVLPVVIAIGFPLFSYAAELKVDGSSKDAFAVSLAEMAKDLSPADKDLFRNGFMNLVITRYPPAAGASGLQLLQFAGPAMDMAPKTMDGVTKEEILARGRQLAESKVTAGRSDALAQTAADRDRSCLRANVLLSNVKVEHADFFSRVSVDLTNHLTWAISFVELSYSVKSKARSVPWSKDKSGMSISGGIEPGETRTLSTTVFNVPNDAVDLEAHVELLDVHDADDRYLVGETKYAGSPNARTTHPCAIESQ